MLNEFSPMRWILPRLPALILLTLFSSFLQNSSSLIASGSVGSTVVGLIVGLAEKGFNTNRPSRGCVDLLPALKNTLFLVGNYEWGVIVTCLATYPRLYVRYHLTNKSRKQIRPSVTTDSNRCYSDSNPWVAFILGSFFRKSQTPQQIKTSHN